MSIACQIVLTALMAASVLIMIYRDINGAPAKSPEGFAGVVGTIVTYAGTMALWWGSGAFDHWFGR
jgi:hypothetical protein